MDIIKVDGKEYDPYFILDVTREDDNTHITKSFRSKVKKYHPDKYTDPKKKEKYEKYFKILNESYRYIKSKREICSKKDKGHVQSETKNMCKDDLDKFNKTFDKKIDVDENTYERIKNIDDYKNTKDIDIYNLFDTKKFKIDEFNNLFEYNKQTQEQERDKIIERSLIHKTSDGFYGYNSNNVDNCALVSTFNGLMISGDILENNGCWGSNYGDYKFSYKLAKNPQKLVNVKVKQKTKTINPDEYIQNYKSTKPIIKGNFQQQNKNFEKKIYENLIEQELHDEEIVKKYIDQYDNNTISKAFSGELPQSIKYSSVIQKYLEFN
jgi:curved DNA-binding protein CbpA